MAYNINQEAINFQCNDIAQFSTKTLEDYSIVSRKKLEKIIKNSERRLTEDEHRWLIERDCKRVISNIKKYTHNRRKLGKGFREESKEGIVMKLPISDIDHSVLDGDNKINIILENNLTVINVQQLNININDNNNTEYPMYDNDIHRTENNNICNSEVFIMDLERIYWDKWRDYVKKLKFKRKNRCEKIDNFLTKIQEKLHVDQQKSSKMQKTWCRIVPKQIKTTYDRQQIKIENQKKLLEKQQKEIERLKLQQLKLESEKAMLENQKLIKQTFNESEKRLKIKHVPPKSTVALKANASDILNRMEIRALDRQAKWEALKERRRKMEQEQQRKKQQLEENCLKEQMELKRKQLFEARENMKLKKNEECKRKMERKILRDNIKIADNFYRKCLLKKGLEAFIENLMNVRTQIREASYFYDKKMLEICFNKWRFFVNNNSNEKIFLADQFYKQKLMKTMFLAFFKILEEHKKEKQVADDWHDFKLQEFCFKKWLVYVREINAETYKSMLEAESYHNRIIIKRCFDNWRRFPEIVYKERLKDCRLRMWHEKVQEILPDFIPPEL
ncbi:coiled-coil domain-containing protein 191 isoform X2 [Sipha flava]|uniref:Coiled-coil domain-containing protein 191 isoform X2 n=1 Tax=Sipha flava TaxID=143950 RepID=A0A8B8GAW2_9HEMI|nr:coiled-coil domain-containing protein 191 isoform X2 [Sipha flava]